MKVKCASCGAVASLDVLITSDGARDAVLAALEVPAPIGKLLIQYLALFRPQKRELTFDRVATLINELLPMIKAGVVERSGRDWPAPLEYWRAALEDMLTKRDRLDLPMKSHGYLLEIIAGMSNKAEAATERKKEEEVRHRPREERKPAQEEKSWDQRKQDAAPHIQELVNRFKTGGKQP